MVKELLLSLMLVLGAGSVMAQTDSTQSAASQTAPALEQALVYENPKIHVRIGEIKYVPKKASDKTKAAVVDVLSSVITNSSTTDLPIEDESMVSPTMEALRHAATKALRFRLVEGDFTPQQLENQSCVVLNATITGCNTTVRMHDNYSDKLLTITAFVSLTDPNTGEVVASRQITSESWASSFETSESAKSRTAYNFGVYATNQFNSWFPLRGHMLEKGFEKGKKQKLKEIYIDLGSDHKLGTGYNCNVYTVRRIAGRIARKYIGRGNVIEVLGGDISTIQLKKGADLIKQAFDNGAEIAVEIN